MHGMQILDLGRLEQKLPELRSSFAQASPFPYIVIDDFLDPEAAQALLDEFGERNENWTAYNHYNERKSGLTRYEAMGPRTRAIIDVLGSRGFLAFCEKLSGIDGLMADPDLDGGGLHSIQRNGFLNVHVDFKSHTTRPTWSRQLNLLLYLNRDWQDEWGGFLELWDADVKHCVQKIKPIFNRCVVFQTSAHASYHGHPTPLACPENVSRRSLALYYFRDEHKTLQLEPTHYRARPNESLLKHALVAADRAVLRAYSFLKRYTPINDRLVSRVMKRFES